MRLQKSLQRYDFPTKQKNKTMKNTISTPLNPPICDFCKVRMHDMHDFVSHQLGHRDMKHPCGDDAIRVLVLS